MGDVRRLTRKRPVKPKTRRKPPHKAKRKQAKTVTFTADELIALNRATTLLSISQKVLEEVWDPIRQKYGISREIQYDRKTGKVS